MGDSSEPRPLPSNHAPDILSVNLPDPGRANPDPRLQQAVQEAYRMHQVTPILKEELRAAIMLRRLSSGQGEIRSEDDSPPAEYTVNKIKFITVLDHTHSAGCHFILQMVNL